MKTLETSRRVFLQSAAGAAAFGSALGRSRFEAPPAGDASESYWQMIRWQFPFREARVPMNAANLCPSPLAVAERVTELTRDIDIDCSFQNRDKFAVSLEESRRKVAEHLGVSADEIALVRNTSEGNNVINNGLSLKPGDEVIVWNQNHPTNNVAWDVRAARYGLVIRRVATPRNPSGADELVDVFKKAFTPKTRVLAITHLSNVSGLRLPVRALCELAHRQNIFVHVDGAQTWGALHVDLGELGCDSYAASAHKWFVGPKEAGVLYVKAGRIAQIWPNCVAPGWGDDADPDVRGARRFESLGQRDDACLAAVGTAVDFHRMIGVKRIEARVQQLATRLKNGLTESAAKLVTPLDPALSGGVCVIEVPADKRQHLYERLYREHGIAGSTSGGLRLCPHVYNTMEHIDRAIEAVKKIGLG